MFVSMQIKLMEDRHAQELKSLRERIVATEQEKRDKWTQQKTKAIKVKFIIKITSSDYMLQHLYSWWKYRVGREVFLF